MALYRDTGVVLRVHKLGEADRIITVLTGRHGKIRTVAKGVRRTRSRWGARLEPFNHVDVQCYTGRSWDFLGRFALNAEDDCQLRDNCINGAIGRGYQDYLTALESLQLLWI